MQQLQNWQTIAVAITAILAAAKGIGAILSWLWKKIMKPKNETLQAINNLKSEMCQKFNQADQKLQIVEQKCQDLKQHYLEVKNQNDQNEKDRLRDIIFRYGNYARRGTHISSEQFRNLQRNYVKYRKLGGNDIGQQEYKMTAEYYNRQEKKGDD